MKNTIDNPGEDSKKQNKFLNILKTAAIATLLTSCWGNIKDIHFNSQEKAVDFDMVFTWWDYLHYDVTIKQENDSTFYGLVDGDWFFDKKEFRWKTPDEVFESVTDELCEHVSEAQLSSQESITNLEVATQNKIRFIQKKFNEMLENGYQEETVQYNP